MEPGVLSGVVGGSDVVFMPGMMSLSSFDAIASGCRVRTAALKLIPESAPMYPKALLVSGGFYVRS